MKKNIVLCADDYGQAPAISQGIVSLLKQGRLSATSCMVNTAFWPAHAAWLQPFKQQIGIGLHVNLTEGRALSPVFKQAYGECLLPLRALIPNAIFRRLDPAVIVAECEAQLACFIANCGFPPHFIDGHQHIQQLPVIRDAFVAIYDKHLRASGAYVRLVNEPIKVVDIVSNFKKVIIHLLGTNTFKQQLREKNIIHNQTFAGIYRFSRQANYRRYFINFLKQIGHHGLLMCHPGLFSSTTANDPIAAARYAEYQYFASSEFLLDCDQQGVVLSRQI